LIEKGIFLSVITIYILFVVLKDFNILKKELKINPIKSVVRISILLLVLCLFFRYFILNM